MNRKFPFIVILAIVTVGMLVATSEVQKVGANEVPIGVKAGDWIKYDSTVIGVSSETPLPTWMKVEFLSVEGTNATMRVTMHMNDGTETSGNRTFDIAIYGGSYKFGFTGFVIPANCTTGDSVYTRILLTITGETTRTYAGARRTVVYASYSENGTQLTYYWDKQTGIMVETSTTVGAITGTAKVAETNMWQAQPSGFPIDLTYLYILVAVVIVIAGGSIVFVMRRKKKPPEIAKPTQPTQLETGKLREDMKSYFNKIGLRLGSFIDLAGLVEWAKTVPKIVESQSLV